MAGTGIPHLGNGRQRAATIASGVAPAGASSITATLQKEHEARIAGDAAWKLAVERLEAYRKMADRPTVSLNLAERKASRAADLREMEDLHRRARALAAPGSADNDAVAADDGLTPLERPVGPVHTKAEQHDDPFLHEAAAIAEDEAALLASVADSEAFV